MITSLVTQKNICAALGFVMAITIVWKAKVETNLARNTALVEYTEPTYNTGTPLNPDAEEAFEFQKLRTDSSVL
ncbi:hypothetical protein [Algoriphagus sp. NG3]|uniref:hypothetical protein n=1 Tax=Algoriphagus sp. NG3 TaxID=3097546 RepID=UPI002A83F6D8|nr:hypothetical protein [Algoriphagus sp. NG3]WPR74827.1 hypothetical protein SLW71_19355 [Algoriphagus sp. NG3]